MAHKVSIIVPIYNVAAYIERCLDSISRQIFKDIEVLFIDDCGKDESIQILNNYLSNNLFFDYKVIRHEKNGGLSAARNTGLKNATGEYVYFLDSDDEITPDCISSLISPLSISDYDMVVGGYREYFEKTKKTENHTLICGEITDVMKSYANAEWYVMAWNKLCKREFLLINNLFFKEGLLHEDVLWTFLVANKVKSIYLVDTITYVYYIRSGSIMTSMSIEKDVDIYLTVFTEIKKNIYSQQLNENPYVYKYVEAKKSAVLHSLLQMGEHVLYNKYYPLFYRIKTLSPMSAYHKHIASKKDFIRDLHYSMTPIVGKLYKRVLFFLFYTLRGREIEGAIWKKE